MEQTINCETPQMSQTGYFRKLIYLCTVLLFIIENNVVFHRPIENVTFSVYFLYRNLMLAQLMPGQRVLLTLGFLAKITLPIGIRVMSVQLLGREEFEVTKVT
jgi:hypothetical protein